MEAIVVVVLSVLLALVASALALITMWRVSRVSASVSEVARKVFDTEERQKLVEAAVKIVAFEPRLQEFESKMIKENDQLQQHETLLQQYADGLKAANQMICSNTAVLKQANTRADALTQRIEDLERFTSAIERTHSHIADAFRTLQTPVSANPGGQMQRETAEPTPKQQPQEEHRGAA